MKLPRPELYVVYTGSKPDVPDVIHLSDIYEGEGSVDVYIRVIRRTGTGDILDQYVRFCEIADENRERYGQTAKAIEETLRQCREENILTPFLASRQKEVLDIMVTLFDHMPKGILPSPFFFHDDGSYQLTPQTFVVPILKSSLTI